MTAAASLAAISSVSYAAPVEQVGQDTKPDLPTSNRDMKPLIQSAQIVFADLQPALICQSTTNPPEVIVAAASALAAAGRILALPMTFLVVPEKGAAGSVLPELETYARKENIFSRTTTSPLDVEAIRSAISGNKRPVLILAGFSSEVAVLQTVFGARSEGYEVYVVVDAIGSRSERTEATALEEMRQAGAVVTSARSLLLRMTPDLSSKPGRDVIAVLKSI